MGNKIFLVGIGPGSSEYIVPAAKKVIYSSDVLIGGSRNLEQFESFDCKKIAVGNNLHEVCEYIMDNSEAENITVLASGDPGVYSIMDYLDRMLEGMQIEVIPGISSLQYLCSRIRLTWNDMCVTSMHGRCQDDFISMVRSNRKTGVFTGGNNRPEVICEELLRNGLSNLYITVGENLSYPDERIISGTPEEISRMRFKNLSVMVIENNYLQNETQKIWKHAVAGLPDSLFDRGGVPMTKEEVRAVSLSKLRLNKDSVVFDIGAGTGSVSIECALISKHGTVYAIEKNNEAIALIQKNIEKFGCRNIKVICGEAPSALTGLPKPDRIFIGGTGGNMLETLEWVKSLTKKARIVINAVTIESVYEAVKGLECNGFENIETISMGVSRGRKAGSKNLMEALNTVYIISGEKAD
ncbi:MAG: precorrin-6y C5,15-methyltransferase (decarboxylating) subunit CbiE [Acetivibrionales bacterium]|jgi:precorrin-6Y C5,15-methyltransferase (decarboxylating)